MTSTTSVSPSTSYSWVISGDLPKGPLLLEGYRDMLEGPLYVGGLTITWGVRPRWLNAVSSSSSSFVLIKCFILLREALIGDSRELPPIPRLELVSELLEEELRTFLNSDLLKVPSSSLTNLHTYSMFKRKNAKGLRNFYNKSQCIKVRKNHKT